MRFLAALAFVCAAAPRAQDPMQEPPRVPARLLSSVRAVAPGEEFELGLHLALPAGWHVYWENPGQSGIATSIQLKAPEGFTVEGPLWPGPERIDLPGDISSYGYEGDVVFFFRLRAPADGPARKIRFAAKARWLICQEACFPGQAEPELELELGPQRVAAAEAEARLLSAQRARLPRPWKEIEERSQASWRRVPEVQGDAPALALDLAVSAAQGLEFFPSRGSPCELRSQKFEKGKEAGRLVLELTESSGVEAQRLRARGVLRVDWHSEVAWYALDLAPPAALLPP